LIQRSRDQYIDGSEDREARSIVNAKKETRQVIFALPERGVTVHTGDMGYTMGLFAGEQKCPGRSVTPWMSG
jgi:hypothetical protein